jgi:histidinol-phosphatase (PHP family)
MLKNLCFHSHNIFCDGKNSIQEMIQSAVNNNVTHFGVSSHAPVKFINKWSLNHDDLQKYSDEIDTVKEKYGDKIQIFKSLEIDYIPELSYPFKYFKDLLGLDYTIGSIHLVLNKENGKLWFIDGNKEECHQNFKNIFSSNIRLAIASYYSQIREMIETQQPNIIGHIDKVVMNTAGTFFDETEDWYLNEVDKTLDTLKKYGCIMEVNSRGLYKNKWHTCFPSHTILSMAKNKNIPIIIATDAHHTSEILAKYNEAAIIAKSAGYSHQTIFDNYSWKEIKL